MAIISFRSTHAFRQFRAAIFGISVFLRLTWGFLLALNVFSLTTRVDRVHVANAAYLFGVNGLAVIVSATIGGIEAGRLTFSAKSSQAGFELVWLIAFWVLELVGAVMFTLMKPFWDCNVISSDTIFIQPTGVTRESTPKEFAMCQLSNQLTFFGLWIVIGLSTLYIAFFFALCIAAARRDSKVWTTPVFRFDWSITSLPRIQMEERTNPALIHRPSNPQMTKAMMDSNAYPTPVYFKPFPPSVDSFSSAQAPLDRHQVMAHYHSEAPTPARSPSPRMTRQMNDFRFSALGLSFEPVLPPTPPSKHKPSLSITIPPQEPSDIIPIHVHDPIPVQERDPHESIGYSALSMPFSATDSSQQSHQTYPDYTSTSEEEQGANDSTRAVGSHHEKSNQSIHSYKQSKAMHRGVERGPSPPVQVNEATVNYAKVEEGNYRQSTLVNMGSYPSRRPVPRVLTVPAPLAPQQPTNVLPLHQQDVQPRQYAPYSESSHGDRPPRESAAYQFPPGGRHTMNRSNNTWPPHSHPRQAASLDIQPVGPFPFRVPPPPMHPPSFNPFLSESPVGNAPPSSFNAGKVSHARSASSPIFYYNNSTTSSARSSVVPYSDNSTVTTPYDKKRRTKLRKSDPNVRY